MLSCNIVFIKNYYDRHPPILRLYYRNKEEKNIQKLIKTLIHCLIDFLNLDLDFRIKKDGNNIIIHCTENYGIEEYLHEIWKLDVQIDYHAVYLEDAEIENYIQLTRDYNFRKHEIVDFEKLLK